MNTKLEIWDISGYYSDDELRNLCSFVKPGDWVVEIGVLHGRSAIHMAQAMNWQTQNMVLYDNWLHTDNQLEEFKQYWKKHSPANTPLPDIRMLEWGSQELTKENMPIYIDLAHLDGCHDMQVVLRDMRLCDHAKYIALHDYAHEGLPGIKEAYNAFMSTNNDYEAHSLVQTSMILKRKNHA